MTSLFHFLTLIFLYFYPKMRSKQRLSVSPDTGQRVNMLLDAIAPFGRPKLFCLSVGNELLRTVIST